MTVAAKLVIFFRWAKDPAIGIELFEDLIDKPSTDLIFSRDGGYRGQGILLEAP